MVDPQGRINRLRKMLVRRTSLTGPVCGTQYCPVEKTPYVLITIFLLILHHYLKSTKTYLNKRNSGLRGTRGTGKYGNRRTRQQLIFIFSFCVANFHPGGKSIKSSASKYPALQNLCNDTILGNPGADGRGEGKSKQGEKYGTKEK